MTSGNGADPLRGGRRRPRVSNRAAAVIAIVVIAFVCYVVFGGSLPFQSSPFVLRAVFTANTNLHIPSPVRIAGVEVGQVTGVQRIRGSGSAGVVTMQIDSDGLPIHADATAAIRSRLFLEGNFYVALEPGSPGTPTLQSGATLPAANTAGPVQLDRILSALNAPARQSLQTLVQGLGAALNAPAAGGTGAEGLNQALKYSAGAFEASAIVNQALLGQQPHDLSGAVSGTSKVFGALASSHTQLASLVSSFDATMAVLASHQQSLQQTLAALPGLLRSADSADDALDASFGPTQAFAADLLPGARRLGPTVSAAIPWLAQLTALVGPGELGALISDLKPAIRPTTALLKPTAALLDESRALAQCLSHNIVPTGNEMIQDPPSSTGLKVFQELFQSAVGLAGAGQNFDGNGRYVRASVAGGSDLVHSKTLPINGPLFGNAVLPPLGARPKLPAAPPPINGTVACDRNPPPDLNRAVTGAGP